MTIWIIIILLLVVSTWLTYQTLTLWDWAKKASKWMDAHYLRHLEYHENWRSYPGHGEGDPPPFP